MCVQHSIPHYTDLRFLNKVEDMVNQLHSQLKEQQNEMSSHITDRYLCIPQGAILFQAYCTPANTIKCSNNQ